MKQYRVTKYNPRHRNARGHYTRDEWTSVNDVGKLRDGSILTQVEYERVENAYIDAVLGSLRAAGIRSLTVQGLENSGLSESAPIEGAELEGEGLAEAMRSVLREEYWCRFVASSAFVHFGYDYYMYVGIPCQSAAALEAAGENGLFVEPFESPYAS